MMIPSLNKALIKYLLKKRSKMIVNGSNCADIDKKLKEYGHYEKDKS